MHNVSVDKICNCIQCQISKVFLDHFWKAIVTLLDLQEENRLLICICGKNPNFFLLQPKIQRYEHYDYSCIPTNTSSINLPLIWNFWINSYILKGNSLYFTCECPYSSTQGFSVSKLNVFEFQNLFFLPTKWYPFANSSVLFAMVCSTKFLIPSLGGNFTKLMREECLIEWFIYLFGSIYSIRGKRWDAWLKNKKFFFMITDLWGNLLHYKYPKQKLAVVDDTLWSKKLYRRNHDRFLLFFFWI